MQLEVGDIITFPKHAESKGTPVPGGVSLSQGAAGRYRVIRNEEGVIHLEALDCIVCGGPKPCEKCARKHK